MTKATLNTAVSLLFRSAVLVHFACLYVLFFGMKNTLGGMQHHYVAVFLTILMFLIAVLFITDMATPKDASRRLGKVVDVTIGCIWVAVVAFLFINSMHAGE